MYLKSSKATFVLLQSVRLDKSQTFANCSPLTIALRHKKTKKNDTFEKLLDIDYHPFYAEAIKR